MDYSEKLLLDLIDKAKERGSLGGELPYLEFKLNISDSSGHHGSSISFEQVGKYISGLANAACIHDQTYAYLVLGVEDETWNIVGTNFWSSSATYSPKKGSQSSQNFHLWLDSQFQRKGCYEIIELDYDSKHLVIFKIPSATGEPISYQKNKWIRIGSSLTELSQYPDLERRIYLSESDWSAQIVPEASLEDLDPSAISKARELYTEKNQHLLEQIEQWDDITFLNKAKVTIKGKITRAALLLLGKEESSTLLSPYIGEIRWILCNSEGQARDYLIKTCPFILTVEEIYRQIRNLKYRYINSSKKTLFPEEIDTYEPYVIREAIYNALAHQDYLEKAKINVIEYEDSLLFENRGQFIPSSIQEVLRSNAPETKYRNPHLVQAMRELRMVDTIGSGIRKMFQAQRERFFPMPNYEIDADARKVQVSIIGKVLDERYTNLLINHTNLTLVDMEMLNRVYFHKPLSAEEVKYLRKKKLISGRSPNIYLAKTLAQVTGQEMQYTKNEGLDNNFYKELIIKALRDHGSVSRAGFEELLLNKLPDILSEEQKTNKIGNLLTELRKSDLIEATQGKMWILKS